jgi:tRNA-specific 2-thiouridylase
LLQRDAQGRAVVELAALEAGVSPGQACVFYESAEPLARVLGGGFIVATDMVAPLISNPDAQAAASV